MYMDELGGKDGTADGGWLEVWLEARDRKRNLWNITRSPERDGTFVPLSLNRARAAQTKHVFGAGERRAAGGWHAGRSERHHTDTAHPPRPVQLAIGEWAN
jgi:hypothetical protein